MQTLGVIGCGGVVAVLLLSGCAGDSPDQREHAVVLQAPAQVDFDDLQERLTQRLDGAQVDHVIQVEEQQLEIGYDGSQLDEALFTAPGAVTIRPALAAPADSPDCQDAAPADPCSGTDPATGAQLSLGPAALDESTIESAEATLASTTWTVLVSFTPDGAVALEALTAAAACAEGDAQRVVILLDGAISTAPSMGMECGQSLSSEIQLSGGYTQADAALLAGSLSATLPEGTTVVSYR